MLLRLSGCPTHTEGNKLYFTCNDPETMEKLRSHCNSGGNRPYSSLGFTTNVPKYNIGAYFGRDCIVKVKVFKYQFTPTTGVGAGTPISGVRLVIVDIEPVKTPQNSSPYVA